MITVDIPASFKWNDSNSQWAKNYLRSKQSTVTPYLTELQLDVENLQQPQFIELCQLLESSAEGREIRNKMFKAWRSKKSRDSNDGKKLYTFNMSIKAGEQLKKIAKGSPLNKTLEALIFLEKSSQQDGKVLQQHLTQLQQENALLQEQLDNANLHIGTQSLDDTFIEEDIDIKALARMEKSQLVKKIILLNRKLKQS